MAARAKTVHPLIAALIDELPPKDQAFAEDKRRNWLNMMAMALGTIYGGEVDEAQRLAELVKPRPPAPKPAPPAKPPAPVYRFIIDEQGHARNGKTGQPILKSDVNDIVYDLRGIDGDAAAITWADGSTGLRGADITIAVA